MKPQFLFLGVLFLVLPIKAQINVGASIGVPIADVAKTSNFTMNVEFNYLFESLNDFKFGPSIAVHFFVDKTGGNELLYLPLSFAARFGYSEKLILGADVGYAIGMSPQNIENGFYYRPMIGYYLSRKIQITSSIAIISLIDSQIIQGNIGVLFSL